MKKKSKELAVHDTDTGSSEVQIAQLTDKIENLSKHIKNFAGISYPSESYIFTFFPIHTSLNWL